MYSRRNINVDLIKVFALILVCTMHFFLTGYYELKYEVRTIPFIAIRNYSAICVPLFIMVTGYLNFGRVWSKKLYLNIVRVFFLYATVIVICSVFDIYFGEPYAKVLEGSYLLTIIKNIVSFEYYGWYMNMYFGLVVIAPGINIIYEKLATKHNKRLMIIHLLLIISIPVTLLDIFSTSGHPILGYILPTWWKGMYPVVYYVLGLYFREYGVDYKNKKMGFLFVATIVVSTLSYYFAGVSWETTTYPSIFLVIMASITFLKIINLNLSINKGLLPLVVFISNSTLPAYLLSWIVDTLVMRPFIKGAISDLQLRLYLLPTLIPSFILVVILTFIFKYFYKYSIELIVNKVINKFIAY